MFVNTFALDVFGGSPMVFGGIFPIAVALQLGPWYGLAASLIAELPAAVHLHPLSIRPFYGFLTHVLEVVVVGWVSRRRVARFMAPLVTDVLYWMMFGIPVLLLATHTRLDATPMWALVIKNLMNGMVDVTLADLITGLPGAAKIFAPPPVEAKPLRTHLSRGFLLATAVPFLTLNVAIDWIHAARLETEAGAHIHEAVARAVGDANDFVEKHQAGIASLAMILESETRKSLEPGDVWLEKFHTLYPAFRTLAVI